ncbi:hypothetical protein DMA11_15315 [Marinilabiliaceae bacterium JC017]|nr:hypothetical protein DMA11_15315 [Marinilabiliaceae bacterium JC017]
MILSSFISTCFNLFPSISIYFYFSNTRKYEEGQSFHDLVSIYFHQSPFVSIYFHLSQFISTCFNLFPSISIYFYFSNTRKYEEGHSFHDLVSIYFHQSPFVSIYFYLSQYISTCFNLFPSISTFF